MSRYLKQNLDYLKKNFPNLYEFAKDQTYDKEKYLIQESKNSEANICVVSEHDRVFMHSRYNPTNEAESWVASISEDVAEIKNILIFGLAGGYHLQSLINRFPNKKIYIYEPDYQLFLASLEARDMRSIFLHSNIATLAVGKDQSVRHELLTYISFQVSESFKFLIIPIHKKLYSGVVEDFIADTEKILRAYRTNLGTVTNFQLNWPENILLNMVKTLKSPSIKGLQSSCNGLTSIIVGSGPSLKHDINYLRKLKNHCLIIAAGSSIQALLHHQIEPHLIVSMDAGEPNLDVFKDLNVSHIPFLYVPFIKHEILEMHDENLIHVLFDSDLISSYLLDSIQDLPRFVPTATVTGTAIQAAIYLGSNRIVFMGQDLSYPNDQFYVEGVDHISEEKISEKLLGATEIIENVNGGINRTTKQMAFTLKNLEDLLGVFPEVQFINTSKIGAKIKNTMWQDIEEVYNSLKMNQLENDWFHKVLKNNLKYYDTQTINNIIDKIHKTKDEIQGVEEKLELLHKSLSKLDKCVKSNKRNVGEILLDIDKSWKWITNQRVFDQIYFFGMQHYMSVYMRHVPEIVAEQDIKKKAALISRHLGTLVNRLILYTAAYLSYFGEAIKRIDHRFPRVIEGEQR